MAQFRDFYIPSADNDGHVWRVGYYKPERRPGFVTANEGQLRREENYSAFTCDLFACRKFKHQLSGRATKKAIAQQLAALLTEMKAAGVVPPDRADHYIAQALAI